LKKVITIITNQVEITKGAVNAGIFLFIMCIVIVERIAPTIMAKVVIKLNPKK